MPGASIRSQAAYAAYEANLSAEGRRSTQELLRWPSRTFGRSFRDGCKQSVADALSHEHQVGSTLKAKRIHYRNFDKRIVCAIIIDKFDII